MTEEDAFLAAIVAEPRDDAPRLVFADWLEDRGLAGDADRAEFIRLSVRVPEVTFGQRRLVAPPLSNSASQQADVRRGSELCRVHWFEWAQQLSQRLEGSPLRRWLSNRDCRWGYRRGFVAVFEGTEQVILDAWDDLFRLGPVEEVTVNNLWHFGTVLALRQFLDRPSMRFLLLRARELRDDDVNQLAKVADWLVRLERVELRANNPNRAALQRLEEWLGSDDSLRHVSLGGPRSFADEVGEIE